MAASLKALERENLRQAYETLRKASAYFTRRHSTADTFIDDHQAIYEVEPIFRVRSLGPSRPCACHQARRLFEENFSILRRFARSGRSEAPWRSVVRSTVKATDNSVRLRSLRWAAGL